MKNCLSLFFLFVLSNAFSQNPLNAYANVTAISGTSLSVNNVNETFHSFEDNEFVIVMQMQDDVIGTNTTNVVTFGNIGAMLNAGRFEVARIASHTEVASLPNSITLASPLANTYNIGTNSSVQIISYRMLGTNFTSTANIGTLAWNGFIGGVTALSVTSTFSLNHNITANGAGFQGGVKNTPNGYSACNTTMYTTTLTTLFAGKGQGIYKRTNVNFAAARGRILNGGGGGNDVNGGGGGGGNYTSGGDGGSGWTPSGAGCSPIAGGLGGLSLVASINASRVFMGGGGGGGHENDGVGTVGGAGGGIILIRANTLATNSCAGISISANGITPGNASNDGAGGAGAGGSIVLQINTYSISGTCPLTVSSNGGSGGSSITTGAHGAGGGGGQGVVIYSSAQPTVNVTTTTLPGAGGSSCSGCGAAVNGVAGGGPNNSGIIVNTSGVLPIELLSFNVTCSNKKCEIDWETITERNNDFFEVEKSTDAIDFYLLEKVKSKAVNGNSNSKIKYATTDNEPVSGTSYYRLKQTDLDQSFHYSKIISVANTLGDNISFVVYPNPNKGEFSVNVTGIENNHDVDVFIYSASGKMIYNAKTDSDSIRNKQFSFQLGPDTANGLYKIVFMLEGIKYTCSFIIQ